jgi:cytochrome c-type biogenesis protein CcsB
MTNQFLASYSNVAVYSAMAVLTLAMLAFTVDLARAAAPAAPVTTAGAAAPAPRTRRASGVAMALTWLGGALAVAGVVLRGLSVTRVPWGNMYEFATTGAAAVIAAYLLLGLRRDLRWLGLFVVGPALLTLGLAVTVYYTQASQLLPALRSVWLVIHVSVAIVSIAVFTVAFSVTVVYLIKARRETRPPARTTFMEALPDAATLERTSYALHIVAFPLWTFTLIAGAIWAEQAWGAYWQWDPKEVWTFIIWVVYAAYLHARATGGWSRTRAALIACVGYAAILVNYMVVNVYFVGMHSYSGM